MGAPIEFNWVLKLPNICEDELIVGNNYPFSKKGVRFYPLGTSIDLVNENWEAVGRCIINNIEISPSSTTGSYTLVEKYNNELREILTKHYHIYNRQ